MVQIRREREEAFGGKAVGDVLDVIDEPPILLHNEDTVPARSRWTREVAICHPPVGLEFDHRARHCGVPPLGNGSRHQAPRGCCWVRQWRVPNPHTRSTAWTPMTWRSGNSSAIVFNATRSLGSLKVGTRTTPLAM